MKEYVCKNGEIVKAMIDPNDVNRLIVFYKGKQYTRDVNVIGKTLYERNTLRKVTIESLVTLCDEETQEVLKVYIIPTEDKRIYSRAGGSYYGAKVEIFGDSELLGETIGEDIECVTASSPLGKAIINKMSGDQICFETPDKQVQYYRILDICY